ncbi:putative DNA-(apurinic or apyrimidinic site) lyase transcription factor GRF family [Helianthus anomalus]|nr:putative DNA-(apurinic or apyrimidinic site) lyase transcription factor GRF family [Helianthus annuus]
MVLCRNCGSQTIIKTSWTATNPGRKFYCCISRRGGCGFVDWAEGPSCQRAIDVFRHFMHEQQHVTVANQASEIRHLQDEALTMAVKYTRVKMLLLFSWVFFVLYYVVH